MSRKAALMPILVLTMLSFPSLVPPGMALEGESTSTDAAPVPSYGWSGSISVATEYRWSNALGTHTQVIKEEVIASLGGDQPQLVGGTYDYTELATGGFCIFEKKLAAEAPLGDPISPFTTVTDLPTGQEGRYEFRNGWRLVLGAGTLTYTGRGCAGTIPFEQNVVIGNLSWHNPPRDLIALPGWTRLAGSTRTNRDSGEITWTSDWCWSLTRLPDRDYDGIPDQEDARPDAFEQTCGGGGGTDVVAFFTASWEGGSKEAFNGSACLSQLGHPVVSWSWDFGDGVEQISFGPQITHDYPKAGIYTATLTCTDDQGHSGSVSNQLTVNAPLVYAPLVYFHAEEEHFPGDADNYIQKSSLWYQHGEPKDVLLTNDSDGYCDPHLIASRPGLDLGMKNPPYAFHFDNRFRFQFLNPTPEIPVFRWQCQHQRNSRPYTPRDFTKPESSSGNKVNHSWEGFYLDLGGQGPDAAGDFSFGHRPTLCADLRLCVAAPAYSDYEAAEWTIYHFFYPYNLWKLNVPLFPDVVARHESDWEKIAIKLDSFDNLVELAYYQHHCDAMTHGPGEVSWADDDGNENPGGTHPIVYSARGSHASYTNLSGDGREFAPCGWPDEIAQLSPYDAIGRSASWSTWFNLQPARSKLWFGFGGAWGWGEGTIRNDWGATGPGRNRNDRPYVALPEGW